MSNFKRLPFGCSISLLTVTKKLLFFYTPEEPYVLWDGQYERPYWEPYPDFPKMLKEMKDAGIETVELGICCAWLKETILQYAEYGLKEVEKAGLKLASIHMPFSNDYLNLSAIDQAERRATIDYVKEIFKITDAYKPDAYVFHPGGRDGDCPEKSMQSLILSCKELCKVTPAKICIENMVKSDFFERADQVKQLLDSVKEVYACVDVNHFLKDKPEDAILKIGNRIGAIHISDNDATDEKHLLPGKGVICWDKVIDSLNKVGFNGSFNYELSMDKWGYTYDMVADNYKELFKTRF